MLELMTPAQAARALGVNPKSVARWADAGKLKFIITPGGHRRYLREDVERFLVPPTGQ